VFHRQAAGPERGQNPEGQQPAFLVRHELPDVVLEERDGLPRQDHGQPCDDALHQVGDGQKTQQGGKRKKGKTANSR
jgi:hypothetical protein